ncbi:unnamed protein product [Closterium sp. NIES-64]|nr:unnamed protein product [Closterium sp. NIES-64]
MGGSTWRHESNAMRRAAGGGPAAGSSCAALAAARKSRAALSSACRQGRQGSAGQRVHAGQQWQRPAAAGCSGGSSMQELRLDREALGSVQGNASGGQAGQANALQHVRQLWQRPGRAEQQLQHGKGVHRRLRVGRGLCVQSMGNARAAEAARVQRAGGTTGAARSTSCSMQGARKVSARLSSAQAWLGVRQYAATARSRGVTRSGEENGALAGRRTAR